MKDKKYNPQPLLLQSGAFFDEHYDGYTQMEESVTNWEHHCTYQLLPHGLTGQHQVLHLHSMQLSYGERPGGMMNDVNCAKDTFTFAIIEESKDKICFDRLKIQAGDILFLDDSRPFSFMSNDAIKFCTVNIQIDKINSLLPEISDLLNHTIKDTNDELSKKLRHFWREFTDKKQDEKAFKKAEDEISNILLKLLSEQTPLPSKLTKGEEVALAIRDQVYEHMDGKVSIESLAKQYEVSEKTLQNSFKSLFGFTPKRFLRLLKLNHVSHELKNLDPKESTVSKVAQKWGFSHMGYFSKYYTELFGESPSQTLKNHLKKEEYMSEVCASRQEEIV